MAVESENSLTVRDLAVQNIEPGPTICTEEASAYQSIVAAGHDHRKVNHSAKEYVNDMAHTNGIESVWAVVKRGYPDQGWY